MRKGGNGIIRTVLTVCCLCCALPASGPCASMAPPQRLVFAGSGSNLLVTRILAHRFMRLHPGVDIEVPESIGSKGGIRAIIEGAVTLGLISRELQEEERNLGLAVMSYARSAVVIGVHVSVAESDITFEDIVAVYRGAKSLWKDGREIIVLTREPGDSSIDILTRVIPEFGEAYAESWRTKRWTSLFTDQVMDETLARVPYALGISDLGNAMKPTSGIKALSVNGISPILENVSSGKYPFIKTLSFVFFEDKLSGEARSFLEFVRSEEGSKIMRSAGYVPVE